MLVLSALHIVAQLCLQQSLQSKRTGSPHERSQQRAEECALGVVQLNGIRLEELAVKLCERLYNQGKKDNDVVQ